MSRLSNKPGLAGFVFLALPLFFFLAVALKFGLGIGNLYDPLDAFFGPDPHSPRSILAQIVVFFGPLVAFGG